MEAEKPTLHNGEEPQTPVIYILTSLYQSIEVPSVIYDCIIEVDERVVLHQELCQLGLDNPTAVGVTGEKVNQAAKP